MAHPGEEKVQGDLKLHEYLMGGNERSRLLSAMSIDRTRGNGEKLKSRKFYPNTRNNFFV